eukprot:gnl/MRDRNA2_/MRDRNA2_71316_c0_seq1.p1 gnl/MRDRNA2_/MRDRNA2_71316_c0~~gnl/MRDRNA2_/MRDRNA2_71316_c0_seq1.p1  ORF type:complete len:302 (+),score=63.39 gnl/MRDRNA2_/MRDRNA2_71316_c0_seq1:196-1101(+)
MINGNQRNSKPPSWIRFAEGVGQNDYILPQQVLRSTGKSHRLFRRPNKKVDFEAMGTILEDDEDRAARTLQAYVRNAPLRNSVKGYRGLKVVQVSPKTDAFAKQMPVCTEVRLSNGCTEMVRGDASQVDWIEDLAPVDAADMSDVMKELQALFILSQAVPPHMLEFLQSDLQDTNVQRPSVQELEATNKELQKVTASLTGGRRPEASVTLALLKGWQQSLDLEKVYSRFSPPVMSAPRGPSAANDFSVPATSAGGAQGTAAGSNQRESAEVASNGKVDSPRSQGGGRTCDGRACQENCRPM